MEEFEPAGRQFAGHYAAAFDDQLRLGAQKERPDFQGPQRCGQAEPAMTIRGFMGANGRCTFRPGNAGSWRSSDR